MPKELLFSITKKDFKIDYFSGSGAGGQHRNKHQNCVRLHHPESETIVTGQSHKERKSNIREALKNLISHPKFKMWQVRKVQEVLTGRSLEDQVKKLIEPQNIRIEARDSNGRWMEIS